MSKIFNSFKNNIAFNPFKKDVAEKAAKNGVDSSGEIKETVIKRMKNYVTLVLNDYKHVAKESLIHMKDNPVKTTVYGSIMGTFVLFYKKNPDYQHYIDTRRSCSNDMIMCASDYNKKTEYYLNSLNKLEYCNLLEYRSYLIFSLVLAKNFSDIDSSYEKQCAPLQNPSKYNVFNYLNIFLRFISRIVDIGFFDNWYFLNKHFTDYDVNESEWSQTKNNQ